MGDPVTADSGTMRAAVLVAPGRIEIEDRPVPVPGRHELLVRVRYAGVCGTDLALYDGQYPAALPLVLGHEFCGDVVAAGAGVDPKWGGAFVTAEISESCVTRRELEPCAACRASRQKHCLVRRVVGIRGADGAFADFIRISAAAAHRLPDNLSPWAATLAEPLAAAIQTFEAAPISPGETVAVLGAGRIGLLVISVARSFGARVIAVSRNPAKRALSLRFGAHTALDPATEEDLASVASATGGLGADVVVDCTGSPTGLPLAIRLVRACGTIVLKSTGVLVGAGIDLTEVVVREITIRGSRCGPIGRAIERLDAGKVPVDEYVAGVYPLEEAASALEASRGAEKVLIEIRP